MGEDAGDEGKSSPGGAERKREGGGGGGGGVRECRRVSDSARVRRGQG